MKMYRIMKYPDIHNLAHPFYVERWVPGGLLRFGYWISSPFATFVTEPEAKQYIEQQALAAKEREERLRAKPLEIVRGYVANDGQFYPVREN